MDDSMYQRLSAAENRLKEIDEELLNELKYSKGITFQYYFGTQKALNLLQRICHWQSNK